MREYALNMFLFTYKSCEVVLQIDYEEIDFGQSGKMCLNYYVWERQHVHATFSESQLKTTVLHIRLS